ncbi:MAG: hypothetical protein HZC41_02515 [Chloroflexi bacterium]|nr:hypothetical protein [Chloroflexota bacterium]
MRLTRYNLRRAALLVVFLLLVSASAAQDGYIRSPRLGITFISSLDYPRNEHRYQRALLIGVGWNRWPLYWNLVETAPGGYDWSRYDALVRDDVRHGLQINAILLGRPAFFQDGGSIAGLRNPVFADGSDTLAPGKAPNPANPWATFVYLAVTRYKPGGLLAAQEGWPRGAGVRVWEAWNEPDIGLFWNGTVEDYTRLLQVTYLAAHAADPDTRVMFGGLAYNNPDADDWLAKTLAIIAQDPARASNGWYMDAVAVHNYTYPRRSGLLVRRARENLAAYGLQRPIWLNESGVPVWDDYPGPTWTAATPAARVLRATTVQQAAFVVQSTVYAWAEGAETVFFHQLFDDCGNQPFGTNFPPNDGSLCAGGGLCWGDAHGLYRNDRDAACFSQHPLPGTPRPAASAFYRLAQVFGATPFASPQIIESARSVRAVFEEPAVNQRITVIWNRTLQPVTASIPAAGGAARLYSIENEESTLTPLDGAYTLELPPATQDDYPHRVAGDLTGIGGQPLFLVERIEANSVLQPATPETVPDFTPTPRPTVDPALDTTPPVTTMAPLPTATPPEFTVAWSARDDSGIQMYVIFVRENGGTWQKWLETADTSAVYRGQTGATYDFAAWAVDLAGNWSLNVELQPQASTKVE